MYPPHLLAIVVADRRQRLIDDAAPRRRIASAPLADPSALTRLVTAVRRIVRRRPTDRAADAPRPRTDPCHAIVQTPATQVELRLRHR